jgi:transposase
MSQSALPTRRFATIRRAAEASGVSYETGVNYIKRGELTAYKLPGKRGHYVDLDEAEKVFTKRQKYGTFGPDAKVRDLSNVVADFEVVE